MKKMGWFSSSDYEKHEKKLEKKMAKILSELEAPELRKMCKALVGSAPRDRLKILDDDGDVKHEFRDPISRKDYIQFLDYYENDTKEINGEMFLKYFVNHNLIDENDKDYQYIRTHDEDDNEIDPITHETVEKEVDEEKDNDESNPDIMMDSIMMKLERKFEPEKVIDEKELQNMIRQFLQTTFPKSKVEREAKFKGNRDSVDILVDDKYAIEAKIPNNRTELRNLTAQLEEYKEEYPNIMVFIMDNEEKNLSEDIEEYTKKYKSKLGIESVVKIGKKRG